MSTYQVSVNEIVYSTIVVEAESEAEAHEKVRKGEYNPGDQNDTESDDMRIDHVELCED